VTPRKDKKPSWSVEEILLVMDEHVGQARRLYREEYGVLPSDKSIDTEIAKRFEWALNCEPPSLVELPQHLVLALMLREGFAGRLKGKKGRHWAIARAVRRARERKASLVEDEGVKAGKAAEDLAKEYTARLKKGGYRSISVARFRRLMESDK